MIIQQRGEGQAMGQGTMFRGVEELMWRRRGQLLESESGYNEKQRRERLRGEW